MWMQWLNKRFEYVASVSLHIKIAPFLYTWNLRPPVFTRFKCKTFLLKITLQGVKKVVHFKSNKRVYFLEYCEKILVL